MTPAAGEDDRDVPAASRELPVDLLVDVHDRGMADHQQSPPGCAAILLQTGLVSMRDCVRTVAAARANQSGASRVGKRAGHPDILARILCTAAPVGPPGARRFRSQGPATCLSERRKARATVTCTCRLRANLCLAMARSGPWTDPQADERDYRRHRHLCSAVEAQVADPCGRDSGRAGELHLLQAPALCSTRPPRRSTSAMAPKNSRR